MIRRLFLAIVGFFFFLTKVYAAVGTKEIHFVSKSSKRIITAEVYYPTAHKVENKRVEHGIWLRGNYHKEATILDQKRPYPLIVFSHGFQGDRFGNSWFAEKLVAQGYVVVMIEHTLNTSYEHSDLFVYTSMWQRPIDVSELLSHLLAHSQWGKIIDPNKIAVAGFSLGGTTALWLGGMRADKKLFKETLDRKYSRWSDWPESIAPKAQSTDWRQAELSYRDPRIKGVISFSPDLGEGFSKEGFREMSVPTLIIVGDKDP